jgi:hypothetical protein
VATVMARFFNTDFISFSMTSGTPYPGITRKFWSFSEAARENGASRILNGIHFSTAVNAGYLQSECIGEWVFEHALRSANSRTASASPVSEKRHTEAAAQSLASVDAPDATESRGSVLMAPASPTSLRSADAKMAPSGQKQIQKVRVDLGDWKNC